MVDNFDKILPLLEFPKNGDSFYFIQVLQRKKDHQGVRVGGSNNNSRLIKAYHIDSIDKLLVNKDEMIKLAHLFEARIGINLNPRSFEKTAFQLLIKVANQMHNRDFYNVRKSYDSVCGNYHAEMDKRWLVDIDTRDESVLGNINTTIQNLQDEIINKNYGVLAILPTKSGFHIITNPFNLERFSAIHPGIEVHKNNPTNLYIP
jgi:hypothetical protein